MADLNLHFKMSTKLTLNGFRSANVEMILCVYTKTNTILFNHGE